MIYILSIVFYANFQPVDIPFKTKDDCRAAERFILQSNVGNIKHSGCRQVNTEAKNG